MKSQVNLIRSSEQRSASMVSLKSLALIFSIVIPLVILLLIAWAWMGYTERRSALQLVEGQWEEAERRVEEAQAVSRNLREVERYHTEVDGWNRSRLVLHEWLAGLQQIIPEEMQLRTLQARQRAEFVEDAGASRFFTVTLTGRCVGPDAENTVEVFRETLESESAFDSLIERVAVTGFQEDQSDGAAEHDRVFQIDVTFKARSFIETAGE